MPDTAIDPALRDLRVVLLQARDTPDIERQEQTCFLERCRLDADQLRCVNVVRDDLSPSVLDGADALLIGGSGEYSVARDYGWTEPALALVRAAVERRLPTFGSCWGHQLIARAVGGTVRYAPDLAEFGCIAVHQTDGALHDPLLRDFPRRFLVNAGHKDRVVTLPPEAVELAYSDTQRHQAFRLGDAPVYGTQFHSELDATRERERLVKYRALYLDEIGGADAFDRVVASLAETTEVDHLLHDFLVKFAVRRESPVG